MHSPTRPRRSLRAVGLALATAATLVFGALAGPNAAVAQNPYERGPAPTESSIEATRGHYSVSTANVSSLVFGFGGGTIYYPTTRADGTFGAVAIAPGYTASSSTMSWLGPRLASQGFVVFTIDTNSRYDQPGQRADQLNAALDYLVEDSTVSDRIDPDRLAVMGHSMGGGGSLEATTDNPDIQASIPLTPWHSDKTWNTVRTPTLIFGAENDTIASVGSHSERFYSSIPSSTDKMYIELDGASHFAPNSSNTTIAKYSISWLKRFVDNDTRYDQFLCPLPDDRSIEEVRGSCPIG
ncbi:alpha/beta hydrolase [Glycomyces sp. TRM65418]|uniref:poly(ethylene terephthalate) hydrolase family protein n=1 Tax=Glycomyces sp. TRM65418 TaxID=2867006 RepID=UPI001CE4F9E2|nr:alpha/beta hydrolase [Glycomyces sp. TRM65418]MCC3765837.1 alpha/beta hydrolase [Glycomyces sp. TRM65418]QZD55423.1 alpha/beta hydrolase [Glycomyces sp. TRM65418]